jgi:uncharacterized RDD family membrane protein YckC
MNTPKISPQAPDVRSKEGRKEKYLAIFLIAVSIVSLVMTPKTLPWLILLEGAIGIIGVLLFVYARLKFWREIKKSIQ